MRFELLLPGALCLALPAFPAAARALTAIPTDVCAAVQTPAAIQTRAAVQTKDRGYLGVHFENLTSRQRANLGLKPGKGAAIAAVDHDAPAGKAGLRRQDVVVKLNGKSVRQAAGIRQMLSNMAPGQAVILDIFRHGQPMEIHAVLADRDAVERRAWSEHYTVPDPRGAAIERTRFGARPAGAAGIHGANGDPANRPPRGLPYTGVELETISPQLARFFGVKGPAGLLARNIDPNSPGSRAGLKAGDIICTANGVPITSRDRWDRVLKENRDQPIRLSILRRHQPHTVLLVLVGGKS